MLSITSLQNERVRRVQALQRSTRRRLSDGLMVIEGFRLVRELISTCLPIVEAFCTDAFLKNPQSGSIIAALEDRGSCYIVPADVFAAISDTQTPQGILVVLQMPQLPVLSPASFCLVVDGLREPGNLGTVLRTAWAAGVGLVLLSPGTVDHSNPKVIRGAMGAHFHVPIWRATWEGIADILSDRPVWLAEAGRGIPYYSVDWSGQVALMIGGEAAGAAPEGRALAGDRRVTIPMVDGVDSINVSAAAAVILFEVARQQRALQL